MTTDEEKSVRLGRACREGIKAMGLELFSPDDDTSAPWPARLHRDRAGVPLEEAAGDDARRGADGDFDRFDAAGVSDRKKARSQYGVKKK